LERKGKNNSMEEEKDKKEVNSLVILFGDL